LKRGARQDSSLVFIFIANFDLAGKIRNMPTVLRIGPYRFHFYSREGDEPPHIHVARDDFEAKFWLEPVSLAANYGFSKAEISKIQKLVEQHCQNLIESYIEWHGH
jgi:hypothetical protein